MADYLTERDDIDPSRIGITGESLGGVDMIHERLEQICTVLNADIGLTLLCRNACMVCCCC